MVGRWWEGLTDPGPEYLDECLSKRAWKRTKNNAHRSRGRLEDPRFIACVTADIADLSISCAAQIEDIDSSKGVGSSTSAGIRLFKSSTVRSGVEVEVGWIEVGSDSGNGETWRDLGVLNLTAGFAYGRKRLRNEILSTRNRHREGGNSPVPVLLPFPHDQAPVFLKAIAAKRKPSVDDELQRNQVSSGSALLEDDTYLRGDPRTSAPTRRWKIDNCGQLNVSVLHAVDVRH